MGYPLCISGYISEFGEDRYQNLVVRHRLVYIPALFRALRCRIDSRRHRDGGTEKKGDGGERSEVRRGEVRRDGGEPMSDGRRGDRRRERK